VRVQSGALDVAICQRVSRFGDTETDHVEAADKLALLEHLGVGRIDENTGKDDLVLLSD
jgi:hypothetical protein